MISHYKIPKAIYLFLTIGVLMALFSYYTVWLGDDINYAFDFRPGHGEEIVSSFGQVLQSLNAHYIEVNGRHLPHFMVQMFVGIWGRTAFAIANGLMYMVFLWSLCRLCRVNIAKFKSVLSVTVFALIIFQTKMTPTCQIGYIWTFTLAVVFLLLFFSEKSMQRWWQLVLLTCFAIVAGNGNEGLNLGLSAALIIYWFKHKHSMSLRRYLMMIGFGLGTLIICLSPASRERADSEPLTAITLMFSIQYMILTLKATWVLILVLVYQKFKKKVGLKNLYRANQFYFNALIALLLMNGFVGFGSNRQVFGAELMSIVLVMRILPGHTFNRFWLVVSSAVLVVLYCMQADLICRVRGYYQEICRQYHQSTDGIVFVDIDQSNYIPYSTEFSPKLYCNNIAAGDEYEHYQLAKHLRHTYGARNNFSVLPKLLQPGSIDTLRAGVYPLAQSDYCLLVQPANEEVEFRGTRRCIIPLAEPRKFTVNIDTYLLYHTDSYKAKVVELTDPFMFGTWRNEYTTSTFGAQ